MSGNETNLASADTQHTSAGLESTLAGRGEQGAAGDALPLVDRGHYVDDRRLGQGGMGYVIAARDRRLERTVAVKQLRVDAASLHARFVREARLTARLEHPSIVCVHEAGQWASGEPFYAMRIVQGRSLDHAIAAATSLRDRIGLVPNVIAVADAVGYAHARGIIHRDIKPQNVMLGEHGETIVIDWGLAKDLRVAEPEATGPTPTSNHDVTQAGVVLGTPAYMPPEQVDGRTDDPRVDVYAIGALLYHVLAGRAPYEGTSTAGVLAAVASGPPPALAGHAPDVPPDLVAIVERAMARDPAERYASGRDVAADLRRFQAGQLVAARAYSFGQLARRWMARHRTLLVVIATAFAIVVALSAIGIRRIVDERARAEQARVAAEANRREAESLVVFMLNDLAAKTREAGSLPLLDTVATRARAYFERFPGAADLARAELFAVVGEVAAGQGRYDEAVTAYEQALAVADHAADKAAARGARSRFYVLLGDAHAGMEKHAAAIDAYQRASELIDGSNRHGRALLHGKLGDLHRAEHRLDDAGKAYAVALELFEQLAAEQPENALAVRELAVAYDRRGELIVETAPLDALPPFRKALAIRERIAAAHPDNAQYQKDVGMSHFRIGQALATAKHYDEALVELQLDLAISARFAAQDHTNAAWARDLAVSEATVAETQDAGGHAKEARQGFERARAILVRLMAASPDNAQLAADVAELDRMIATCCR